MLAQAELGARFRRAREDARLSQTEAAKALGVTPAALSQYEAGRRRVDSLVIDRLSRLYGVPVGFFFGREFTRPDWEEALRLRAAELSPRGRAGLYRLAEMPHDPEDVFRWSVTPLPGLPHPAFAPLPEKTLTREEVAAWADRVRHFYDLGVAPLFDLWALLDTRGFLTFSIALGRESNDASGLFLPHPELGSVIVINRDHPYAERPFALAHGLAHAIFHYDRPVVVCRTDRARPSEAFADLFASFCLIPREALDARLRARGWQMVETPEQVVHFARSFGVSYETMLRRLSDERRLNSSVQETQVKPLEIARTLGYRTTAYEWGAWFLPPEERLPRVLIELPLKLYAAQKISIGKTAELIDISELQLRDYLSPAEPFVRLEQIGA